MGKEVPGLSLRKMVVYAGAQGRAASARVRRDIQQRVITFKFDGGSRMVDVSADVVLQVECWQGRPRRSRLNQVE